MAAINRAAAIRPDGFRAACGSSAETLGGPCRVPRCAADRPHSLPYDAALDGLRGVAILGVVGTHFGVPLFRNGANGVDLFFVLSGFLITSVLTDTTPPQTLPVFYWNRLTRLLPALTCVCAAYAIFGCFQLDRRQTAEDVLASVTYVANWTRAFTLGVPRYLAHTWSLSLEEQFYLVYPPVLLGLGRLLPRRMLALLLLALSGAIIVHRAMLGDAAPERLYNGLDTHADGLALGCALALWRPRHAPNRVTGFLARGDLLALLALPLLFSAVPWPQAVIIVEVVAAWLIFGASHPALSSASGILRVTPLVWLGKLSYSLYLWHYPVLEYLAYKALLPRWQTVIVGVPVSVALAAGSYYLVERPVLRWRRSVPKPIQHRLGLAGAALTASAMAGGLAFFLGPLVVQSFAPPAFAVRSYTPHASVAGEGFNVQPGGLSVVWIDTTTHPPKDLAARWDGKPLATYSLARRVAIFVPRAFVDTVGPKTIEIETEDRTMSLDVDIVARK